MIIHGIDDTVAFAGIVNVLPNLFLAMGVMIVITLFVMWVVS
jgi:hypothetical protein